MPNTDSIIIFLGAVTLGLIIGLATAENWQIDLPEPVAECRADADHVCIRLPIDKD